MTKRGENIHKRKDGRWEGRYIKGRTAEGKPVWGYLYGYAYREVREELIKQKALSGFYQLSGKSMRFSELAELWLASLRQGIKESTYAHYQYTLHKYLLPVLGNLLVSSMTDSLLERLFLQILLPSDRSHKPLGASSAQECFGMLRRICKYAAHLHLMPPIKICVKLPHTQKPEPQPLTRTEQDSLREFLLSEPTTRKIGMLLQMELGLRIGDDDDKIRLNQRKPSKYKGLSRFGPEKNLQRINKFMKERPTFYKKLIQMKENFRFYLRCFYCITKVVILQFNSEKQDRISS